jgi:MFS family permease
VPSFARSLSLLIAAGFGIFAYSNVYYFLANLLGTRGVSPQAAGVAVSLFYVATTLFRPAGGWLVEGFGLRPTLVGAAAVAFAGSTGLALAGANLPIVLFCRFLMGIGYSVFIVAFTAYQNLFVPPERRGFAFALLTIGLMTPHVSVIPVADWLLRHGHVAAYLSISPIMALFCAGIGWSFGKATIVPGTLRRDSWGTYGELFRLPPVRALLGSMFLLSLTDSLTLCLGALLVSQGLVPSAFLVSSAVAALSIRVATLRFVDRIPRTRIAAPCFALMAAAMVALSFMRSNPGAALCGVVFGLGVGMGFPAHLAMVGDMTPERLRPKATAMVWFAMDSGWAVTPFVFGLLSPIFGNVAAFGGYGALMLAGAAGAWQFLWKPVLAHPVAES